MHKESFNEMKINVDKYLNDAIDIIDIGSLNVKKDGKYMQHMRRFTVHRDKLKTPIEQIKKYFDYA